MAPIHPFLVDQRPYLARTSSSSSVSSTSSTSSETSSIISSRTHTSYQINHSRTTSTSSTTSSIPEIDATCLRFMRDTSESEHLFGSIGSRSSRLSQEERSLRRELVLLKEEKVEEVKVEKRKRFGRIF